MTATILLIKLGEIVYAQSKIYNGKHFSCEKEWLGIGKQCRLTDNLFVCKSIIFTSLDRWFEIAARRLAYFERETKNIIGHFLD